LPPPGYPKPTAGRAVPSRRANIRCNLTHPFFLMVIELESSPHCRLLIDIFAIRRFPTSRSNPKFRTTVYPPPASVCAVVSTVCFHTLFLLGSKTVPLPFLRPVAPRNHSRCMLFFQPGPFPRFWGRASEPLFEKGQTPPGLRSSPKRL